MEKIDCSKFVERMSELMPKFNQRFKFKVDDDIIKLDLGVPHIMTMKIVSMSKTPLIISEIAKKLSISYPMMTHIINRMESKKLLRRIRNVDDRRIVRVVLTKKGEEISSKFHACHKKRIESFLQELNKSDRDAFLKSMNTIFAIMERYSNSKI